MAELRTDFGVQLNPDLGVRFRVELLRLEQDQAEM